MLGKLPNRNQRELFRTRLADLINPKHELALLADKIVNTDFRGDGGWQPDGVNFYMKTGGGIDATRFRAQNPVVFTEIGLLLAVARAIKATGVSNNGLGIASALNEVKDIVQEAQEMNNNNTSNVLDTDRTQQKTYSFDYDTNKGRAQAHGTDSLDIAHQLDSVRRNTKILGGMSVGF